MNEFEIDEEFEDDDSRIETGDEVRYMGEGGDDRGDDEPEYTAIMMDEIAAK